MSHKMELIFHIGSSKTGTTAIQNTLHQNRKLLREDFLILYPDMAKQSRFKPKKIRANHCHYFSNFFKSEQKNNTIRTFQEDISHLIEKSTKEGIKKIIFSCEWLFQEKDVPLFLSKALSAVNVDVRFILYLRRQDLWTESAWKQWGSKNPRFLTIQEYIDSSEADKLLDYKRYVDHWLTYFSKDQIDLHTFERSSIGDNVITHFLCQVPLTKSQIEHVKYPSLRKGNVGYSQDVILLLQQYKQTDIHDNTLHHLLNRALPETYLRSDPFRSYGLIDLKDREKIMARYREKNKAIARIFFEEDIQDREGLFLETLQNMNVQKGGFNSYKKPNGEKSAAEHQVDVRYRSDERPQMDERIYSKRRTDAERAIPILLELFIHQEKRIRRIESRYSKVFKALPLPGSLKSKLKRYLKSL